MNSVKKDQQYFNTAPSPPAVKYHGLVNQGATCYLNSVLQVLSMTKDFREAVGRDCRENPECIDPHLYTLFDRLNGYTTHTNKITMKLGIDNVKEQRDAAEYYEKILRLTSRDASKIFHGLSTHKTICSTCYTETGTDEAFWHLPLALVDSYSEHYSVLDGIEDYFKTSEFIKENQMYCEQCDAKSDATSKYVMKHHPEVLMLLLKRFEFDYRYMMYVKINRTVDVPCTLQIPENQTYELYAVVDHFGGLRSGHYTATIKANERWYNFDDERVTLLSYQPFQVDNLEQSSTAYLLFYKKIKAHAADTCAQDTTEESRPEGFTPVTIDINDQHEDDVKKKKREEGEGEVEAGDDTAVGVSTVSDKHVHLNKEGKMSGARKRKMEGDEQSEKKMKSSKKYPERYPEHQDSEGLDDVRQNLNKDMGGTQQVGQDYDLKPLSVDGKGDGKKIEIDVEVDKEGKTGSKTGQLLTNPDPCSQEMSELVSGGVGDSQQDTPRHDQRCRQESSSTCKRPEQQRDERDDKDAQRKEISSRHEHCGQSVEDQSKGSEQRDSVRHSGYQDVGMERQTKEQEKKRDEHIQNKVGSSLRRAGSAGNKRVTENEEISRVEKMRQTHPQPKTRNEFTEGRVEGRLGSKTSRPCIVITDDKIEDSVQSSNEKPYTLHKEPHKLSQVEHNEGNVQRKSGPKTDENVILSESVHSLQLSESCLQEPQEHRSKRAMRNVRVEAAEMNCALEKRGKKKTRIFWQCFFPLKLQHKQKNKQKTKEKKESKKTKEKRKTQGCFPFAFKRRKNAVQNSESEDWK